jgi:hypothetical protein
VNADSPRQTVIPAKAGIQYSAAFAAKYRVHMSDGPAQRNACVYWITAFAGMTVVDVRSGAR